MSVLAPLVPECTETLTPYVDAGVLEHADVHLAAVLARATDEIDPAVLLAAALAVRGLRLGHVCIVPADVPGTIVAEPAASTDAPGDPPTSTPTSVPLPWPSPEAWDAALRASAAVACTDPVTGPRDVASAGGTIRPLVYDGERVYLQRYWWFERLVGDDLLARAAPGAAEHARWTTGGDDAIDAVLDRLFPPAPGTTAPAGARPDRQRQAAHAALTRGFVVIAGGPGTGKTRTVARVLAALHELAPAAGRRPEVALAAPTGKAAARMTEAVHTEVDAAGMTGPVADALRAAQASTLHRLLGSTGGLEFRHGAGNPLTADVVVVDEASMVSLPLIARLVAAVRPDASLVLVGDPYQLASIEAGAVLGDVVGPAGAGEAHGPLAHHVVVLDRVHRFAAESTIAALADAVRRGEADAAIALLRASHPDVEWVDPDDGTALRRVEGGVLDAALPAVRAALAGDASTGLAAASHLKVLAATRHGPLGTYDWRDRIERALAAAEPRLARSDRWYVGRPVIVTRNDYQHQLFNGDTGLVVAHDDPRSPLRVAFGDRGERTLLPSQLDAVETWWSMTVHKSQGSEFAHVVVSLPTARSPILSRELLYTAVTRAQQHLTIVAGEDALRAAIARRITRASGLEARLWPDQRGSGAPANTLGSTVM